MKKCIPAAFIAILLTIPVKADPTTEQKFQDIFITAGYATAFGAALGAASLSFFDNPQDHLQHVAIGASLGFIGGSVFGSYMVFSPGLASAAEPSSSTLLADNVVPRKGFALRPNFDPQRKKLTSIEGAMTLFSF